MWGSAYIAISSESSIRGVAVELQHIWGWCCGHRWWHWCGWARYLWASSPQQNAHMVISLRLAPRSRMCWQGCLGSCQRHEPHRGIRMAGKIFKEPVGILGGIFCCLYLLSGIYGESSKDGKIDATGIIEDTAHGPLDLCDLLRRCGWRLIIIHGALGDHSILFWCCQVGGMLWMGGLFGEIFCQ